MQLSIVNRSKLNPESRLDSEYYKPQALAAENRVVSRPHWLSGRLFDVCSGPFGSTVTTDKYDPTTNLRYIRGKDVYDFFVDDSDPINIQKPLFNELTQYHLKPLDILVTVVGMNFGKSALVFSDDCPSIFSCKSSLIRNVKINPFYLTAYFSCKYGYALLRRGQRGAAQPGINLFDLRNIPVPIVSKDFQDMIEKLVLKSRETIKNSSNQYTQAEQLLLSELGLQNWKLQHTLTYVRNYSQAGRARRMDAEYFQPKYQEMFDKLSPSVRFDRLGKLVTYTKGIEVGSPAYQDSGVPFWRVSNLTKHGLDDDNVNFINDEVYNSLRSSYEPQQGEMLLSKDATPGLAYYLEQTSKGIVSSGILRLTITNNIPPHYLELVLNSLFVQLQIEQDAGGSVIKHWKPSEVRKTLIPRLSIPKENEIAELVQQSHEAWLRAKSILEKAKRAVEIAIEEGEDKAKEFLE
jgi:type I restriction enzyme S subunit